ncbi:MAG: GDP-mannose 4,6-dehydratase [Elusimicrobia bacterium]|nr:GDP-mannose 4,6-dehydratase [Elusimicrobiota bacterium]
MSSATPRKAFITGITGQDGSYLAELLLGKGYEVHGLVRRTSMFNTGRIIHLFQDPHEKEVRLHLHYGDMLDAAGLSGLINKIRPDEVYHLAAQSHVRVSFEIPSYTCEVVGMGTASLLEAIHQSGLQARYYQASSSEMYGAVAEVPQTERTPFRPRSPYAAAKLMSYWLVNTYREAYGLYAVNGILFNHESPRRGETFVTRKITRAFANILAGRQEKVYLGNLEAKRDWGYAAEYVEGMWRMLQQEKPDDYVLATGETHTVREFLDECCRLVDLDPEKVVAIDPRYFRAAEVDLLLGDPSKAKRELGWEPKTSFSALVRLMLAADIAAVGLDPRRYGLEPSPDKAVVLGAV